MRHVGAVVAALVLATTLGCRGAAPAEGPPAKPRSAVPAKPRSDDPAKPRSDDLAEATIAAVIALPEVKAICQETEAQGARCTLYPEEPGGRSCPAGRAPEDPCLWAIYLGANMGSHVSRMATFRVDPGTLEIVAVTTLACPILMSLSTWRAQEAASRAGKEADCGE